MLRIGEKYHNKVNSFSRLVFDVLSNNRAELETFINQHKEIIGYHSIVEDNGDTKITLNDEHHEIVEALTRRHNMELAGLHQEADRVEFLEQFGQEAIKAIAYATALIPDQMDIDQYSILVYNAFELYGASSEFDSRVIELLAPSTPEAHWKAYNQLQLLRQLLFQE